MAHIFTLEWGRAGMINSSLTPIEIVELAKYVCRGRRLIACRGR